MKLCFQFVASVLVLTIFLFQHILHLWQQYFSTFGQGQVFLLETFSASSVTTGTQCFAMTHHLCKVHSAHFVTATVVCTFVCGQSLWWRKSTSYLFLWDILDKGLHSNFVVSRVHCQIPVQEGDKNNNILLQKGCSHDFFLMIAHSVITLSFRMLCDTTDWIATHISVQNGGPRFHPPWQFATASPHLW